MEAVRKPRNQWPALGTLLVRDGAVTEEQLEQALALQRVTPELRLGEILLSEGFVTPRGISRVLAEQHELEFVELTPGSIDPSAALLLISFLARRYRALPIRFLDDGSVLIAVADPTNVMFSDGLRLATGMAVRICVAAPDAIEAAIVSVIDGDETELEALTPENDAHADENLLDLNADSPAVVFVNRSIAAALDAGASDIHFTPNTADRQLTTIEDPVEYRVEGLDQVEANIRAGLTFAGGLRTILRSDPDVLLVGEIRDEETAQIAFRAAMTGHLILTTLHAQTAAASLQRLSDMNIEPSILATSINAIVGQRLARRVCTICCKPANPDVELLGSLGLPKVPSGSAFVWAVGCTECGDSGYRGRVPLFEVMPMTDEIALLVGAPTREIEARAVAQGMETLREDGLRLPAAGITTLEEVRRVVGETLVDVVPMKSAVAGD